VTATTVFYSYHFGLWAVCRSRTGEKETSQNAIVKLAYRKFTSRKRKKRKRKKSTS